MLIYGEVVGRFVSIINEYSLSLTHTLTRKEEDKFQLRSPTYKISKQDETKQQSYVVVEEKSTLARYV